MSSHKVKISWSPDSGFNYADEKGHPVFTTHACKREDIKWECDYDFTIDFCDAATDPRKTASPFEPPAAPCPPQAYQCQQVPNGSYILVLKIAVGKRFDPYPYTVTLLNTGVTPPPQDDPEVQVDDTGGMETKELLVLAAASFGVGVLAGKTMAWLKGESSLKATR